MNRAICPYKHRYQLLDWAICKWPMEASRFKKMKKKQLYAIYNNTNPQQIKEPYDTIIIIILVKSLPVGSDLTQILLNKGAKNEKRKKISRYVNDWKSKDC